MGQKPLEIGHLDRGIATLVTSINRARGGTIRSLADESGISRSRIDRLLRAESSMTTTDLVKVSDALALSPWKLVYAAENGLTYEEAEAVLAEEQAGE